MKRLAANDNSKNQVYLGGDENALRELSVDLSGAALTASTYQIDQPTIWMDDDGQLARAPGTKVIFYPQYPEARMSGFARGVPAGFGGRDLLVRREFGRVLLVGLTATGWLIWVGAPSTSEIDALETRELHGTPFNELIAPWAPTPDEIWDELLSRAADLAAGPPLPSVKMLSSGELVATKPSSPHASGYALEAALGIPANATPGPDYKNLVELKTFAGSRISLMTPEPTGGLYATPGSGKANFMYRWGLERADGKWRFNGQHRLNEPKSSNPLTLRVQGWSEESPGKYDLDAHLRLQDDAGFVAASWLLKDMNAKWLRKHDQALYVQYARVGQGFQLTGKAFECHGTDFRLFMLALRAGAVIFDPGHSMVPGGKFDPRSQWRTTKSSLLALYDEVRDVDLLG
jgi:hypothetical protein